MPTYIHVTDKLFDHLIKSFRMPTKIDNPVNLLNEHL